MGKSEEYPFSKDLKESQFFQTEDGEFHPLSEFEDNPDKIVRVQNQYLDVYQEILDQNWWQSGRYNSGWKPDRSPTVSEQASRSKALFTDLASFGVNTPVEFVVGKQNDRPVLYTICDRIDGVNLNKIEADKMSPQEKAAAVAAIGDLYRNLARYFVQKAGKNEMFLDDIDANRQYVYGKKKGEAEPKVYMIDPEVRVTFGQDQAESCLKSLRAEISKIEARLGEEFTAVKEEIEDHLETIRKKNDKIYYGSPREKSN